jgi:Tol biopolymer transport system component
MNEGILFTPRNEDAAARRYGGYHRILLVSPDGGVPKPLVTLENGERVGRPQFLPGGRQLLFTVATGGGPDLWNNAQVVVQDLTSGKRTVVLSNGSDARYVRTGHLVYVNNGSLFAIAFDVGKLRTVGGAVPVVEGVMRAAPGSMGNAHYSFSTSGTLIYVPGPASPGWDLAWADRKGLVEPFQLPQRVYDAPRVSPDDKQVAFESMDGNEASVYVYNLSGQSAARRLTFHGNNRLPIWSFNGKHVAFQSDREGDRAIFWQLADGTDLATRLTKPEPGESHEPESWSPNGEFLLFSVTKGNDISLSTLSMRTKAIARFGDVHSSMPTNATFSPDGKWVAYSQSEGEHASIFVQPFPATGIRHELPREAAEKPNHPVWDPGGKELFFNPGPGQFKSVSVTTKPAFAFGNPVPLPRPFRRASRLMPRAYDITRSGRFVAAIERRQSDGGRPAVPQIQVVLNWFADLQARVPSQR